MDQELSSDAWLIQPFLRNRWNTKLALPALKRRAWNLGILHANGVRAHQPRATPWETGLQWHGPPCKGGGSFRSLRPFRAPECRGGPAFPGCYPGLICATRFQRVLLREGARGKKVQTPVTALKRRAIVGQSLRDNKLDRCSGLRPRGALASKRPVPGAGRCPHTQTGSLGFH